MRGLFEPLVGEPSDTIRWSFDRSTQQSLGAASKYLEPVVPARLEDLAEQWWASLPDEPDEERVRLVLRLTAWVRAEQSQRKALVRRLIARAGDSRPSLRPAPGVLVADAFRRAWFADTPAIAPDYSTVDPEASPGDWRSFFESLSPTPQGKFALQLTAAAYDRHQLKSLMGGGFSPPGLRAGYTQLAWRG